MRQRLRRILNRTRCRYNDCHNPVANEHERITCSSCREWMGLPCSAGAGLR